MMFSKSSEILEPGQTAKKEMSKDKSKQFLF